MQDPMHTDHAVIPVTRMHTRSLAEDDLGAQVQDDASVNAQAGRLSPGHKQKHLDGGSDLRRADRWEDRAAQRRSKKATRNRDRRVRSAETLRDTVLAQIRVASGKTDASPALVKNARKALQPRIDALRAEMPTITEDEALVGLEAAVAALR